MDIIRSADILLPEVEDMSRWSVIACDQFTSDRGYWDETGRIVGEAPSTLNMILPEAMIGTAKSDEAREKIAGFMQKYLDGGVFRELKSSFMYVERTLESGTVRHGIIAAVDLEAYEYKPEKNAVIKASEHTVESRLFKRIELRETALLELPHVLIFYIDPDDALTKKLCDEKPDLKKEYDFELIQDGGRIAGWSVTGEKAADLERGLNDLAGSEALAVGDGNHSLATAKLCWERIKTGLSNAEAQTHLARYALAELVNIYDSGIDIEPIHRVISGTDASAFEEFASDYFSSCSNAEGERWITVGSSISEQKIIMNGLTAGQIIESADRMISGFLKDHPGELDYIHDEESALELGRRHGSAYVLLPAVEREDIFDVVKRHELFPKKSFSIGSAREKRYYLECRRIR